MKSRALLVAETIVGQLLAAMCEVSLIMLDKQ